MRHVQQTQWTLLQEKQVRDEPSEEEERDEGCADPRHPLAISLIPIQPKSNDPNGLGSLQR